MTKSRAGCSPTRTRSQDMDFDISIPLSDYPRAPMCRGKIDELTAHTSPLPQSGSESRTPPGRPESDGCRHVWPETGASVYNEISIYLFQYDYTPLCTETV